MLFSLENIPRKMCCMTIKNYFIGTSGWSYPNWKGNFYPKGLNSRDWLNYYARYFNSTEVNSTFYRRHTANTYKKWYDATPSDFKFIIKAPKQVTHLQSENPQTIITEFLNDLKFLEDKLALILLQFPSTFSYNLKNLEQLISYFHNPSQLVLEFRHAQWLTLETKKLLTQLNCTFCITDSPLNLQTYLVTSNNLYVRLHGHTKWYNYDYSAPELLRLNQRLENLADHKTQNCYVFFNNTMHGQAPLNAQWLKNHLIKPSCQSEIATG